MKRISGVARYAFLSIEITSQDPDDAGEAFNLYGSCGSEKKTAGHHY